MPKFLEFLERNNLGGIVPSEDAIDFADDNFEMLKECPSAVDDLFDKLSVVDREKIKECLERIETVTLTKELSCNKSLRKYGVVICKWKLGVPKLLLGILEHIGEASKGKFAPNEYYHSGVIVYNTLYHFTPHGLLLSKQMLENRIPVTPVFQYTEKSRHDFEMWLEQACSSFNRKTYHFARNNCHDFSMQICKFLEVEFDKDEGLLELQKYLKSSEDSFLLKSDQAFKNAVKSIKLYTEFIKHGIVMKKIRKTKYEDSNTTIDPNTSLRCVVQTMLALQHDWTVSHTGGIYDLSLGCVTEPVT